MPYSKWLMRAYIIILTLGIQACSTTPLSPDGKQAPTSKQDAGPSTSAQTSANPAAMKAYQQALQATEKGDRKRGIKLFTAISEQYPQFSGPQTNLGLIYFKQGDSAKAEVAFNKAIGINPKNATAYNHLGIIHRQQGRFDQAEKAYLSAIQYQPAYANAHLNLGILYDIYLLKLDKALQHYQKYQSLQATEDTTVKKWTIGLKRRLKVSK